MKYKVIRTEQRCTNQKNHFIYSRNFGNEVALEKLEKLEQSILNLGNQPSIELEPHYPILKRQGYKVLILEKNLVFYKVNEVKKEFVIYAVVDQRKDYLNIIRGL